MTTAPATLTVTREIRGTAHWIHISGPMSQVHRATYKAGSAVNAWRRELGKSRAYRITTGGSYNHAESGGQGTFRYSVCYGFDD
jgi:hypothetical protein